MSNSNAGFQTTSLSGLSTYLQQLETSLTSFLLETVLRFQAMTRSRVFLCIESDERKVFCGTDGLVDAFIAGDLTFVAERDVEVTLESTTTALRERVPADASRRRSRRKRKNEEVETQTSAKKKSLSGVEDSKAIVALKSEPSTLIPSSVKVVEVVVDDDEDDEIVYLVDEDNDDSFAFVGVESPDAAHPSLLYDSIPEKMSAKMSAIDSIQDPLLVYKKGSAENKILASILYDFGKMFGVACAEETVLPASEAEFASIHPPLEKRRLFYIMLERFIAENLSRLTVDPEKNPFAGTESDCMNANSKVAYMRNIARSGFRGAFRRTMSRRWKKRGQSNFAF